LADLSGNAGVKRAADDTADVIGFENGAGKWKLGEKTSSKPHRKQAMKKTAWGMGNC
jgi:hypothetical protein